jgi:hypothetical protein
MVPQAGPETKYTFRFMPSGNGASGTVAITWSAPGIAWDGKSTYTVAEQNASFGPEGSMVMQLAPTTLVAPEPGAMPVPFPPTPLFLRAEPTACGS